MASTLASYGLIPVGLLSGRYTTHSFRQFKIASGYATSIFNGDLVTLLTDGTIERETATTGVTTVGVFLGVSYTDSVSGFIQRQYWPASTVASDAYAYVCDDPDALFKIRSDETLDLTDMGGNFNLVQTAAGSTSTGNSGLNLDGSSVNSTATFPLRLIDFWDRDEIGSTYPDVIVKINATHQYNNTTGLA